MSEESTRILLWVRAGSRCQYRGCNKPLWEDAELTKERMNNSNVAHIIDRNKKTHRYDHPDRDEEKINDISNLMLMCYTHHHLIDNDGEADHSVELLREMKREHEERIELLTAINPEAKSHLLLFDSKIGSHEAMVSWEIAARAILPKWYPAEKPGFELGVKNSSFYDDEHDFWKIEPQNLIRQFQDKVKPRIDRGDVRHLSVFGIGDQPLLILLGSLLPETLDTEVYDIHRDPPDWKWRDDSGEIPYRVYEPEDEYETVALNMSLSATIDNQRIYNTLGGEVSIWTMTIDTPYNNFLDCKKQLNDFKKMFRILLDKIKAKHGQDAILNIFPAVRPAIAVEMGRCRMEKVDLPFTVFEQNRKRDGFFEALRIGGTE